MIRLGYCAALVVIGTATGLAVAHEWMAVSQFKLKLVEVGIQVFVFGVAGGLVKLLLDSAAELRNFRSDVLSRLGQSHRTVYRVRRLLRIASDDEYGQLVGELMDARQDLGGIGHDIRITGMLERKRVEIQTEINSMRSYLEELIDQAVTASGAERCAFAESLVSSEGKLEYEKRYKERFIRAKELTDRSFTRRPA